MKEYNLDFAAFYNHENGIVEVVAKKNIEITAQNIVDMISLFESMDPPVEYMISNRKYSYSFSFESFSKFQLNKTIKAVAVVSNKRKSGFNIEKFWPKFTKLAFFSTMEEAEKWINFLQESNSDKSP